jgi:hypothetical protein
MHHGEAWICWPETFKQVIETIQMMQRGGRTIVLVEQNARTGLSIAHHGVVLESGRVSLEGTQAEILNNPEIAPLSRRNAFKGVIGPWAWCRADAGHRRPVYDILPARER